MLTTHDLPHNISREIFSIVSEQSFLDLAFVNCQVEDGLSFSYPHVDVLIARGKAGDSEIPTRSIGLVVRIMGHKTRSVRDQQQQQEVNRSRYRLTPETVESVRKDTILGVFQPFHIQVAWGSHGIHQRGHLYKCQRANGKQSNSMRWQKRVCVLHNSWLLYYPSEAQAKEERTHPRGILHLSNCHVTAVDDIASRSHCFCVTSTAGDSITFSAETKLVRREWMDAITIACHTSSWNTFSSAKHISAQTTKMTESRDRLVGAVQKLSEKVDEWESREQQLKRENELLRLALQQMRQAHALSLSHFPAK
eukprot:c7178_g1_i1.p1 GENE.c7178_g1_i1~~c7178_g1_i1.p1  ORF type:complete len:324 (+),score=68.10 c7178_g1_i1:50-973(+)